MKDAQETNSTQNQTAGSETASASTADSAAEAVSLANLSPGDPVKVTLNLPVQSLEAAGWLAKRYGMNRGQVVRQAVDLRAYLQQQMDAGGKVLIEQDGKFRELVF